MELLGQVEQSKQNKLGEGGWEELRSRCRLSAGEPKYLRPGLSAAMSRRL